MPKTSFNNCIYGARLLDRQRLSLPAARLLLEIKTDEAVGTAQMLSRIN
jgi:hypothetical protein